MRCDKCSGIPCCVCVCVCVCAVPVTAQSVFYVDKNATGSGTGADWCNASQSLSTAIALAPLFGNNEIWVADSTYLPSDPSRAGTFALTDALIIRGGYAGCSAPPSDPNLRDVDVYITILSGDTGTPGQNKYHVVTGSGTTSAAGLEGFTITGGLADGVQILGQRDGAGLYNVAGSPAITDCTFSNNTAMDTAGAIFNTGSSPRLKDCNFIQNNSDFGGAIINLDGSNPILTDCLFQDNEAASVGGAIDSTASVPIMVNCVFERNESIGSGGALNFKDSPGDLSFTDCEFRDNRTNGIGGAVFFGGFNYVVDMLRCTFERNSANNGGALHLDNPSVDLTLCKFIDNDATLTGGTGHGGAIWIDMASGVSADFNNCLFGRNTARTDGGGVYFNISTGGPTTPYLGNNTFANNTANTGSGGGIYQGDLPLTLRNCLLWGNSDTGGTGESAQIHSTGGVADAEYTDWKGHSAGTGNINVDPLLVDADGLGTPGTADDFRVGAFSPVTDAANNAEISAGFFDVLGAKRKQDDPLTPDTGVGTPPIVDMGAYEYFQDCDFNEIHDACEIDCNPPGVSCTSDCGQRPDEDCNANFQLDGCEIADFPNLDTDNNAMLDECQPQIDHTVTLDPFDVRSFSGYIDPRQESTDGANVDMGITQVAILFDEAVVSLATGNPVTPADFSVTSTGGTAPGVLAVNNSGNPTIIVTFDAIIPVQQWTTIIADVKSAATGNPIVNAGSLGIDNEYDRLDIGFLPADVDQDGTVGPFDILEFRQYVNLVIVPTEGVLGDYIDTNRNLTDGTGDPFDLLALRQLINGVSPPSTTVWNGKSLPTRP